MDSFTLCSQYRMLVFIFLCVIVVVIILSFMTSNFAFDCQIITRM